MKIPPKDEQYGFITKKNNQYFPQDLTCKAPIMRRPSAPYEEDGNPFVGREYDHPYCLRDNNEPFCLKNVMVSDKFASIRKAK